jgi:hypothetical protein
MTLEGPMGTAFGLLERKTRWVDMNRRNESDVDAYRCYGALTLEDAYGDPGQSGTSGLLGGPPTSLFEVVRGGHYVSRSLRRSGKFIAESHRGLTWASFDIEDFLPGGDTTTFFLRWQQSRSALGGFVTMDTGEGGGPEPLYGPIYMVPRPEFFGASQSSFTLAGTAPAGTLCASGTDPVFNERGQTPAGVAVMPPLHIVFPWPASTIIIQNLNAALPLLVSYSPYQPMVAVPFGSSLPLYSGATKEIVLAGSGGAVAFNIHGVVSFSPRGV